jgi:pSer/pThr/pTyr-binding forkhead associated (FHA) protein
MSQDQPQFTDPPTARITVQKGPQPNQIFDLALDQLTIGRSSANDVTITDPEISRKQARFVKQGTDYAIEDLGSTNGTFVNERRIVGLTPLHDGDIIEFGEAVVLLYEAESTLPVELPAQPLPQPEPAPPAPIKVEPAPAPPQAQPSPTYTPQPPSVDEVETSSASCRRNALLGCGGLLLLIFLCTATLFFLDAYQQGRLLYCGPLQGFWELILGPFGFAPLCL